MGIINQHEIEVLARQLREQEGIVVDAEMSISIIRSQHEALGEAYDRLDAAQERIKALRKDIEIVALREYNQVGEKKFGSGVSIRENKVASVNVDEAVAFCIERPELHDLLKVDEKKFAKLGEVMPLAEKLVTRSIKPVLRIEKVAADEAES